VCLGLLTRRGPITIAVVHPATHAQIKAMIRTTSAPSSKYFPVLLTPCAPGALMPPFPQKMCTPCARCAALSRSYRRLQCIPDSREDLNPIAVSLLRKRLLQLECACVESRCNRGVSGAFSTNKGM
jgi:hypothetical protein